MDAGRDRGARGCPAAGASTATRAICSTQAGRLDRFAGGGAGDVGAVPCDQDGGGGAGGEGFGDGGRPRHRRHRARGHDRNAASEPLGHRDEKTRDAVTRRRVARVCGDWLRTTPPTSAKSR